MQREYLQASSQVKLWDLPYQMWMKHCGKGGGLGILVVGFFLILTKGNVLA